MEVVEIRLNGSDKRLTGVVESSRDFEGSHRWINFYMKAKNCRLCRVYTGEVSFYSVVGEIDEDTVMGRNQTEEKK